MTTLTHLVITLKELYLGGAEGSTTREKASTTEIIAFSRWDTGSIPVTSTLENQ